MKSTRLINHSLRTISRFKLRTGFMMLGSLVGIAALTLVISAGQAAERKMLQMVGQIFGDSSILIHDGDRVMMGGPRGPAMRLKIDDIDAIAKEVPGITAWDPLQTLSASVRHGEAKDTVRVLGVSERSPDVWNRRASRGEYFDATAVAGSARVAVIGETVAKQLFGSEDPLGSDIQIGSVQFRVIGILEAWGTDAHGMDRDNEIVVPISTLLRRLTNLDTISTAKLLLSNPALAAQTKVEIRRILRERHGLTAGQPNDFVIITPTEVRRMVGQVQRVMFVYLPLVAAISLLVGAIVSASLMLASVNERVGEIGLRRAVGARPEDIRLQFLLETAATTLVGGILGILLGYLGARLSASRMHLGDVTPWTAAIVGILASGVVGLAAGVLPAMRAARLNPAEALR